MRPVMLALLATCAATLAQTPPDDGLPPGHPPINPLPPGHPPVNPAAPDRPDADDPLPAARDEDVRSPRAIVAAYHESMSGPVGAPRDWDRFRSLFLPDARLRTLSSGGAGRTPLSLEPDRFARLNRRYLEMSGYVERSVGTKFSEFGDVAHVWSTYEGLRGGDVEPYTRGMTSFQLLRGGGRWWIASVAWDRERPGLDLPAGDEPRSRDTGSP